jgi:D-erythro-7,8-dihydroneopterin triphosphate epimerase
MSKAAVPDRATIRITNLTLRTIIGANEWERTKQQNVVLTLAIDIDPRPAIETDRIGSTVDYKAVKQRVMTVVEGSRFYLLEKLCHRVLETVLATPGALAATVRIDKPHALRFAESVSVEMHGQREDSR